MITSDPSEALTLPRLRRAETAMRLPEREDVAAVVGAADERFRAFVALAAFAGLRLGEAAALQVGDVDYLRRVLHVRRQVQRAPGGEVDIRLPKYGSERDVYLPDELLALLSRHVAEHRPGGAPTRWMFEGSPGQPPHQNTVGHRWRQTCARAGVSGVTLHDLRHLYAIGLIAAGCDVVTIQRALGHARATTTLNTYAHLWPTAEDRTRRAAGALGRRPRAACHSRGQRGGSVGRFSKALCVRARHGATLCSASRGGGTMPVTRVDQGWLSAARPAQAGGVPRGRTGVMTRAATAVREGRFWVVHVPGVGVTQGRSVREARALAADLVEAMTGTAEDVDVHFEPADGDR